MAEGNNSALGHFASAPMKVETISLPGFATQDAGAPNIDKYRVRFTKIDMDDPGAVAELEILETRGLKGIEVVILHKDKFTFMDKYFLVVEYMELIPENEQVRKLPGSV